MWYPLADALFKLKYGNPVQGSVVYYVIPVDVFSADATSAEV